VFTISATPEAMTTAAITAEMEDISTACLDLRKRFPSLYFAMPKYIDITARHARLERELQRRAITDDAGYVYGYN
jgi:hypothetical protein